MGLFSWATVELLVVTVVVSAAFTVFGATRGATRASAPMPAGYWRYARYSRYLAEQRR